MNIILPHNIYTSLWLQAAEETLRQQVSFRPAALLANELAQKKADIALIPVMDLLTHHELFISKKRGISFDGELSNTYLYFRPGQREISEISLYGDISTVEAILSKLLMKEVYNDDVSLKLVQNFENFNDANYLIAGDHNFDNNYFMSGLNFAGEMTDLLELPFVNFVFCSTDKQLLENFEAQTEGIEQSIYNEMLEKDFDFRLDDNSKQFFRDNISHVVYEFEEQDKEGIEHLLRLPYFHGIAKELIELKFTS